MTLGGIDTPDTAIGVATTSTHALIASSFSGLWIFPLECSATTAVADPATAPSLADFLQVHPNPFTVATTLRYQLSTSALVDLRIYDASGSARPRAPEGAVKEQGEHIVSWNGRDARGQLLPAGVDLARLDANGRAGGLTARAPEVTAPAEGR